MSPLQVIKLVLLIVFAGTILVELGLQEAGVIGPSAELRTATRVYRAGLTGVGEAYRDVPPPGYQAVYETRDLIYIGLMALIFAVDLRLFFTILFLLFMFAISYDDWCERCIPCDVGALIVGSIVSLVLGGVIAGFFTGWDRVEQG